MLDLMVLEIKRLSASTNSKFKLLSYGEAGCRFRDEKETAGPFLLKSHEGEFINLQVGSNFYEPDLNEIEKINAFSNEPTKSIYQALLLKPNMQMG